jgi:two-component system, OmpR family, alkaline phosphatase synthesis response regulator PhoP
MKSEKIKILLVDDDIDIVEILGYNLSLEGYQIYKASNGIEAIDKAQMVNPHLIIMDVMMPLMDGMEACERIRNMKEFKNTIIVFLSARNEEYSQISGYKMGADDYITKPIKPKLLISKVKSLLRHLNASKEVNSDTIKIGDLVIKRDEYLVIKNNEVILLPKKEFELLYFLASKPSKVFTRAEILNKVWGSEVSVGGRTIDVHIRKLREKIGENIFRTIKGIGYKMEVISSNSKLQKI